MSSPYSPNPSSRDHKAFLDEIAPWRAAYESAVIAFIAVRNGKDWVITLARIDFVVSWAPEVAEKYFESANVLARRFVLKSNEPDWIDWEALLQEMADGRLRTPEGLLSLQNNNVTLSAHSWTPPNDQWRRDVVFQVDGGRSSILGSNRELEWELKSASPPYDGVADLADDFGLNPQHINDCRIEAIAWHVAEVDMASQVGETDANLACLVAHRVDRNSVAINYRIRLNGATVTRGTLHGNEMAWEKLAKGQKGVGKIQIPKGSVIQCFVIVNGHTHHQYWIANPKTLPNAKRAAFEEHDPGLTTLREFLFDSRRRGYDARDLEFGVSWLFWLHGFSPAAFGPNKRTQDAPDLLVTAPNGNFLVIECTTGGLKADQKLSKLCERAMSMRRRLDESGHGHLRMIPVIVTPLMRDEVKADIEQAERLGVLVVAKEDLERAIGETLILQDADARFGRAEKTVLDNQRQYEQRDEQA